LKLNHGIKIARYNSFKRHEAYRDAILVSVV